MNLKKMLENADVRLENATPEQIKGALDLYEEKLEECMQMYREAVEMGEAPVMSQAEENIFLAGASAGLSIAFATKAGDVHERIG